MIEKEVSVPSRMDEPRHGAKPISIEATLAWTFISRSWLLFSLVGIGMTISVILLCTLPLFTTVATSADLRNMFGATPDGYDFGSQITINKLSPQFLQQADQITIRTVAQSHVPYISSSQQFSIQTPPLDIFTTPVNTQQFGSSNEQMVLNGYATQQVQSHVTLIQGRLPQAKSSQQEIQIAVIQSVADNMGLKLGSLLYAHVPSNAGNTVWRVCVVGIFAPTSTTDAFIAHVRTILTQSSLQLFSLLDRRAEILAFHKDALFIAITGTLGVNTLAALFLGTITTICVMLISLVRRQIDFSVKVALGMTKQQLIYLLLWEFSLIYIIALLLGTGLGIALSQIVTPLLVFTNSNGNADFFSQLAIPPVQIIIPAQQIIILLSGCIVFLVILLCLCTLTVSRYTLSQALRLNED